MRIQTAYYLCQLDTSLLITHVKIDKHMGTQGREKASVSSATNMSPTIPRRISTMKL